MFKIELEDGVVLNSDVDSQMVSLGNQNDNGEVYDGQVVNNIGDSNMQNTKDGEME